MNSGVRCVSFPTRYWEERQQKFPNFVSNEEYFPKPKIIGEFVVNCEAKETLMRLLPVYRVREYKGEKPWMVKLAQGGFLDIYEIKDGEIDMALEELARSERIAAAKRKEILTQIQKDKLAEEILWDLQPENYDATSRKHLVYSDVLQSLGRNISEEQVYEMVSKQSERREQERQAEWLREAQNWSFLGGKVLGAEGDLVGAGKI
ncbi:hypothetical protein J4402_00955 [Candidatus Pacearchaeota archaeon]|nr:hypothetical protein [Candidatus Pacearchaeota archaeon]